MTDINKWNKEILGMQGHSRNTIPSTKVVRNVGDLKQAKLWDDTVVERVDYIFVDGYGLVKTAPYELHFIYEVPKRHRNKYGWGLYCTCGSIAGVVGLSAYSKLAAPTSSGMMAVCIRHTTLKNNEGIGRHADGSTE